MPGRVPEAWTPGRLLFALVGGNASSLALMPISGGFQAGEPSRLTTATTFEGSVSAAGDLVAYASLAVSPDIWSLPIDGRGRAAGELRRLTNDAASDAYPHASADGRLLVYQSARSGSLDLWRMDMRTLKETALTNTPGTAEFWPVVRPDGGRVAFSDSYANSQEIRAVAADSGLVEQLCAACGRPTSLSPDGRYLLFHNGNSLRTVEVAVLDTTNGEKTVLASKAGKDLNAPRFSPDGRWILFYERASPTTRQAWVMPFRGKARIAESEWVAITDGRNLDREPRWSADGSRIYFASMRDGSQCLWVQQVDATMKRPVGAPEPVYHFHRARLGQTLADRMGIAVGPDYIAMGLDEQTGNVWLADLGTGQR